MGLMLIMYDALTSEPIAYDEDAMEHITIKFNHHQIDSIGNPIALEYHVKTCTASDFPLSSEYAQQVITRYNM